MRGRLYNYLGPLNNTSYSTLPGHEDIGKLFLRKYSQNGRDYYIGEDAGRSVIAYKTPEMNDFEFIQAGSEKDAGLRALSDAENKILDSRHNFIESLPDNRIKSIVRSSNINDENTGSVALLPKRENNRVDQLRASVQDDIETIYLSDEYIDRYMTSLGLNPKSRDLRE